MAGLFYTPQTPDYRGLWNWNPAQTFLTAQNEIKTMKLKEAESERLKTKDALDEEVSRILLPLKVREAEANIGLTMARIGESGARAQLYAGSEGRKLTDRQLRYEAANAPDAISKGYGVIGRYLNNGPTEAEVPATGFGNINEINEAADAEGANTDFNLGSIGGEDDNFLTAAAEDFPDPATSLEPDSYAVSSDPQNLSADVNGGMLPPKEVTREDAAEIKTMARGPAGAQSTMAKSVDLGESKSPLDEAVNSNPLDDFDVDPKSAMKSTLDKNSDAFSGTKKVALPPKTEVAPSLGQTIAGFGQWESSAMRKLNRIKATDPAAHELGMIALEDAREGLRGELGSAYDAYEVNWLLQPENAFKADRFAKYKASGVNSQEAAYLSGMNERQADGILKISQEGVFPDGSNVPIAVESLDHAKMLYNDALRRGMPSTKEDDSLERATKARAFMDATLKNPNLTEEDLDAVEKAGAEIDAAMQLPKGASKLGSQLNRYFKQNRELEEARSMGLPEFELGGKTVTEAEYDTIIAQNMNRIQGIAIKNAPSFKDSAERDAWLMNEETKGLPFKMGIGGKTTVVYATGDPNVVTSYVANGKKGPEWVTHSLVQKTQEPEKSAEAKSDSKPEVAKVPVSEEIKSNLTTASSAKEKLDKMWSGGYAVSPDKAQREEYAATKEELNENLAPVYAQIRKLEQEVKDTGYPNFKGDISLNKERLKQIKELKEQIPLGHRLGKELLGLGKAKAKQAPPQPVPVEVDESNPLLQNWEGILDPRTQNIKGMENVGLVKRGLPSKQSAPAAPVETSESSPWGNILNSRAQSIKGMGNVGFLKK